MSSPSNRRYERVAFFADAAATSPSLAGPTACRTFDVSLGGVGLACPKHVPKGQPIRVEFRLRLADGDATRAEVDGMVRNSRWEGEAWMLGVEFLEPVTPQNAPALSRVLERL